MNKFTPLHLNADPGQMIVKFNQMIELMNQLIDKHQELELKTPANPKSTYGSKSKK